MDETKQEAQTKSLPLFGFPKLLPYLKPYRGTILLMIFLGILSSLADTIYPLFNSYALDHFVAGRTVAGLGGFAALYLGLMVLQGMDDYYSLYQCGRIEMLIDQDLRNKAFNHLQTLSFAYFNQHNVGYIHARVMSDTGKIGELVAWRMMDFVWNVSYIISVFVSMYLLNVRLAFYVTLLVPVAVAVIIYFQRKLIVLNRQIREINSTITGDFNEGITGARSIKTLVIEDRINGDFRRDTAQMYRTSVKTAHHSSLFLSLVTLMSSFALAMVLWQGGLITMEGAAKIGMLSVFMTYAVGILEPIEQTITTIAALIAIQANIERFDALVSEVSDVADSPEVIERYGDNFHPKKENWEPLHGDVEFADVTFRYPDGEENVLEHFSLKIPQGTNVAIVGETGAGKSTLVNLVCRFYEPTEGRILIDGRDARERSQLWLHSSIGYVL